MKYMGSKRAMLQNGLGTVLNREVPGARRFFDLFAGSGAVSIFVASATSVPVHAYDLQSYSAVLAGSVITRKNQLKSGPIWEGWLRRASTLVARFQIPEVTAITRASVTTARAWCSDRSGMPITVAYGGHYFSPEQAIWIDGLRKTLPKAAAPRAAALAALIHAASECAASPGHTAQPFQPTASAKKFLLDAWQRNLVERTKRALISIAGQTAQAVGHAKTEDANEAAKKLRVGDVAFLDPPYSAVHYSRFYHVLESIAVGSVGSVSGSGRYPEPKNRPRSRYSVPTEASAAFGELLETIAKRGARAIVTFPNHRCSNWLSGADVKKLAGRHFTITDRRLASTFSTLGGPKGVQRKSGRVARRRTHELVLVLDPK